MTRTHRLTIGAMLLTGASCITLEIRFAARQRADFRVIEENNAMLDRQLLDLRQQGEHLRRDLHTAADQLGRLPAITVPLSAPTASGRDPAVADWLGRTQKLRALLAQRPDHATPELQLLRDEDWLRIARDAGFETDAQQRRALAALREAAKTRLVAQLVPAVRKFAMADFTRIPNSVEEIAVYLDPPLDAAILARYEIKSDPGDAKARPRWLIRDRAPVDEDYDNRIRLEGTGNFGSSSGPFAWNDELADQMRRAQQSFAMKQPGVRPTNLADVIPYAQPPLPPATVERLLRLDRERQR